jgi:uncharacterized protein
MTQKLERRFRPLAELRVEGEAGGPRVLRGLAVVYDCLSEDLGFFHETIRPGCFTEALKTADVRCLVDHDPSQLLGRNRSKTLRLFDEPKALRMECSLGKQSYAIDLVEKIEREDLDGMSFGFIATEDEWNMVEFEGGERAIRTVIKAEIFDVSAVTFPAYTDTTIALRSLDGWKSQRSNPKPEPGVRSNSLLEIERLRLRLMLHEKTTR